MAEEPTLARYRDPELIRKLADRLARLDPGRELAFMHVCGTHENAIARHGLRGLLPPWLRIIAGPGCPVCVCPPADIDLAARLALDHGAIVATYGDMMHVPGRVSLAEARAGGGDIRVVYSADDAVKLAVQNPDRPTVLLAVGFETTACTTAAAVLDEPPPNFSLLVSHRLIPPALLALLDIEDLGTEGFLLPGHVLTITGTLDYEPIAARAGIPMVVAGFEPLDVMHGLVRLCELAMEERGSVEIGYRRAVRREGNPRAREAIDRAFVVTDARWRGLGTIASSGLRLREALQRHDAVERFGVEPDPELPESLPGCECGQVMVGKKQPEECKLFGAVCTPDAPRGPCMVSFEGTCRNRYLYQEA
jgi:hydrogenase expression/formation protein HypD